MKNLLKLTFILSIVFTFNLNTFGQQQFGIKINGGLSKITNSNESSNVTVTNPFFPSGHAGFYYNLALGKKSSLGAELLFSQIEGKDKIEMGLNGWDKSESGYRTDSYRNISYLSLPVYYGFMIKKFNINGGFQISYALASSGRDKTKVTINGIEESTNQKNNDINIENLDFGPRVGITYNLTKKLAVEGTYYYGLNNINNGDVTAWKLKVQQITFGIRYALGYKEDSK